MLAEVKVLANFKELEETKGKEIKKRILWVWLVLLN